MCNRYIVMTATARAHGKWGNYHRVAVVETDGEMPRMISTRARHVARIVSEGEYWRGRTENCEFARAVVRAETLAQKLNLTAVQPAEWEGVIFDLLL